MKAVRHRRLQDIPNHIPTIDWKWATDIMHTEFSSEAERQKWHRDNYWKYGVFPERLEAGMDLPERSNTRKAKPKEVIVIDDAETPRSHIS